MRERGLGLVLLACVISLLAAYALKSQCTRLSWDGSQYGRLCYNDIQALYEARGLSGDAFVYVHGELEAQELVGGAIEYPVATGVFMWLTSRPVSDFGAFLSVSAIALGPFALLAAGLLHDLVGRRALLWALAPALILYSFHNWDLLAAAALCGGVWLWSRDRPLAGAAILGLGAASKLFPALLLAPLALERWAKGDRRTAGLVGLVGVATFGALNLPFVLANFDGWWATYAFHSRRTADFNSFYTWGFPSLAGDPETLNLVSLGLSVVSWGAALGLGWRSRRSSEAASPYPVLQVSAAMVVAFLLWSKVHSPQYVLWILPFFVLLRVSLGWWFAYALADLAVYVGIFRWFYDFSLTGDQSTWTAAKTMLVAGVWGRTVLLACLFAVFLRAPSAIRTLLPAAHSDAET
ncbi:MAG: glycosyltransferase 87 family protein [Actinomycetota bacterium]|nr:glycosyltransferase 87 family protein [Actinomycetota bacterium]